METKANYALIGAFTIVGFLGLLGFLMWFAKLQLNQQFAYYDAYFPEVAGLSVSSQVLFAGLHVGTVSAIELAPDRPDAVRVTLELDENTPVRVDSRASIDTSAVTGVSQVTITPGMPASLLLSSIETEDTPVIQSSPTALQTIGEQAPELLSRANIVAQQLTQLFGTENQERISNILINLERSTENIDKTMADISTAADAIAGFGDKLDTLTSSAEGALNSFAGASTQAETTLASVDSYVTGDLTPLTQDLKQTAATLKTDLAALGTRAQTSLDNVDTALASATGTMDAAHEVIEDLGPVFTELRTTLGSISTALANLPEELPRITANIGDAADSAAGAFDSLQAMLDGARSPVQTFTREGLPQFSRLGHELRGLVANIDQLVTALKRNPSQILRGQPTPEFRR
ncbi:MlaD family protein [Paracoccus xiamenensis]|uniref:MlaD family protein n=1 Tax=Paracoccus xiamenensis TaxID=2714901 RepID=UPI00140C9895|nr:MlaD family protein [Paracoccus xiamenensis]NHF73425.1 MCE family protein [Paracoccus xiamenensis]